MREPDGIACAARSKSAAQGRMRSIDEPYQRPLEFWIGLMRCARPHNASPYASPLCSVSIVVFASALPRSVHVTSGALLNGHAPASAVPGGEGFTGSSDSGCLVQVHPSALRRRLFGLWWNQQIMHLLKPRHAVRSSVPPGKRRLFETERTHLTSDKLHRCSQAQCMLRQSFGRRHSGVLPDSTQHQHPVIHIHRQLQSIASQILGALDVFVLQSDGGPPGERERLEPGVTS